MSDNVMSHDPVLELSYDDFSFDTFLGLDVNTDITLPGTSCSNDCQHILLDNEKDALAEDQLQLQTLGMLN
jgi:hypothetical protein